MSWRMTRTSYMRWDDTNDDDIRFVLDPPLILTHWTQNTVWYTEALHWKIDHSLRQTPTWGGIDVCFIDIDIVSEDKKENKKKRWKPLFVLLWPSWLPRRLWCHIRTNGMPFACLTMVKYILRTSVVVVIKMKDVVVCHLVRLSVHSTRAATT
jgi:hypothetical protein